MIITLEENDSFLQPDGQATMIVVAVKKDDGKVIRFPYAANRSMSALIQDVNEKIGSAPVLERKYGVESFAQETGQTITQASKTILELSGASDGQIQKECLVKCVKLLPRDKDAPIDMEVGGIYRVLALPTDKVPYYEVIDDTDYHKADIPRRVAAYPEEITFFAKRKRPIEKEIGKFEKFYQCELCGKQIVGHKMEDEKYHGNCGDCNHETII